MVNRVFNIDGVDMELKAWEIEDIKADSFYAPEIISSLKRRARLIKIEQRSEKINKLNERINRRKG